MHGSAAINTWRLHRTVVSRQDGARKVLSAFTDYGAPEGGTGPSMVIPLNVLEKSINKRVQLLLKDNRILEAKLVGYDDDMNMALAATEETQQDNVGRLGSRVLRATNLVPT